MSDRRSHASTLESAYWQRLKEFSPAGSLLVLIISWLWLFPHALLDFDTHHDGYMLAQAIGLNGGRMIHTEVSAQYGPVAPLTQSWFLYLPFSEAVGLRVWTVLHLSLTAFLIADLQRVWPGNWTLPRWLFLLAATLWVFSSDVPAIGYMLPWSSVQSTFLNVAGLYLLFAAIKWHGSNPKLATGIGLLSGFAIGLIPFTRINVGWSLVMACLLIWALNLKWRFIPLRVLSFTLVGMVASMGLVVAFLVSNTALDDYLSQAVIGPLLWALSATGPNQWNTLFGLSSIAVALIPAILATIYAMVLFQPRKSWLTPKYLSSTTKLIKLYLPVALGLISVVLLANPLRAIDGIIEPSISFSDLRGVASRIIFGAQGNVVYFFILVSLTIWVARLFLEARKSKSVAQFFQTSGTLVLVGVFSAANLVQLVPTYDGRHAWWGSALAPLVLLASTNGLIKPTVSHMRFFSTWLTLQCVFVLLLAGANLTFPRFPAPDGSPAEGLQLRIDDLHELESARKVLRRLPENASALFISNDGFIPVADGAYRATNSDFVWWSSPGRDLREISEAADYLKRNIDSGDYLVYQDKAIGDIRLEDFVENLPELDVIFCDIDLCLFQVPNSWP